MADILYLSWERIEFTETSLKCLAENTDWDQVQRLVVYDDGSCDATQYRLYEALRAIPIEDVKVRFTGFRSPSAVMVDYLTRDPAEVFVKIDNDIAVPPGWLGDLMSVWTPEIDLLGMEIGHPFGVHAGMGLEDGERLFIPAKHIGGVGMMRTQAFRDSRFPIRPDGRFGFTEWQHINRPIRGWVFPEINAPCLDRIPVEPWVSLSTEYEARGWQRPWWKYPLEANRHWIWIGEGAGVA